MRVSVGDTLDKMVRHHEGDLKAKAQMTQMCLDSASSESEH